MHFCDLCGQTFRDEESREAHSINIELRRNMVRPDRDSDRLATACVIERGDSGNIRKVMVATCDEQNWVGCPLPASQFKVKT